MSDKEAHSDGARPAPSPASGEPDAHGQAALLLAESTLHALVEAGVLSTSQAVSAIRTAAEVKAEVAAAAQESTGRTRQSLNMLRAIEQSLMAGSDGRDEMRLREV